MKVAGLIGGPGGIALAGPPASVPSSTRAASPRFLRRVIRTTRRNGLSLSGMASSPSGNESLELGTDPVDEGVRPTALLQQRGVNGNGVQVLGRVGNVRGPR